jgi:hypothetical protein
MRTVFQVVATMVVANAAVAYGAGAKDAAAKIKGAATTKAADVKAKATEAAAEVKAEATAAATDAKATATEGVKKAEASAETSDSSGTPTAEEAKAAVQGAMEGQPTDGQYLAGARKSLIRPESGVLPESVLRFRAIYADVSSTKGYDNNGNKVESGLKLTANRSVAVFEYGITDRISAQLLVPYGMGGKLKVDDKEKFIEKVAVPTALVTKADVIAELKAGILAADAQLAAGYAANAEAQAEIDLGPQAFGIKIPAGAKLKDFMDGELPAIAVKAALQANYEGFYDEAQKTLEDQKFQEGLGDIEIGAKYALSTVEQPWFDAVPFYTSIAAGVRLNSSKYSEAEKDGKLPLGRGTMDLGLRVNTDYEPLMGVQLQLENQTEMMIAKGKSYAGGKEVDYERDGMRQVGYSKLVVAPGTWSDALKIVSLNARYNWDNDAATKTDGKKDEGSATYGRSAQAGLTLDGLNLENRIPAQLDYDYVMAARGRNTQFAADAHVVTLKLFYKF